MRLHLRRAAGPCRTPPLASAAFAAAVDDADRLRRRLFAAVWVEGRNLSDPAELDRLDAVGRDVAVARRWQSEFDALPRPDHADPGAARRLHLPRARRAGRLADSPRLTRTPDLACDHVADRAVAGSPDGPSRADTDGRRDDFEERIAGVARWPSRSGGPCTDSSSAAADAVSKDEAAAAMGVARSVAAFHLDRLVADGLLTTEFRRLTGRQGPGAGRPAKLYRRAEARAVGEPPGPPVRPRRGAARRRRQRRNPHRHAGRVRR